MGGGLAAVALLGGCTSKSGAKLKKQLAPIVERRGRSEIAVPSADLDLVAAVTSRGVRRMTAPKLVADLRE